MGREEFNAVFIDAMNRWRELAPRDTGHLAMNAIKGVWVNDNHFRIYVDRDVLENQPNVRLDGKEGRIAHHYYAKTINDKPNYKTYGWVERTGRQIAEYIANRIGGVIK